MWKILKLIPTTSETPSGTRKRVLLKALLGLFGEIMIFSVSRTATVCGLCKRKNRTF